MRSGKLVFGIALALVAVNARSSQAQVTITVAPTGSIGSFGTPASGSTPTYGEVLTDPAGNPYLQSITYNIDNPNAAVIPFQAYVYNWNGSSITGSALYTSAPLSIAPSGNLFLPVSVTGINTALTPGSQYLVFFSTLGFAGNIGGARYQTAPDSAYTGGTFAFSNAATFATLPNSFTSGVFGDLAFTATFTPTSTAVPEPGSVALLTGLSLTGAALLRRRRKTRA